MDESNRSKIKDIKSKVKCMLQERQRLSVGDVAVGSPSDFWSEFAANFDYMLGLEEDSFSKLRLHTYHFTSDSYLDYIRTWREGDPQAFKNKFGLDALTSNIPPELVLNEPEGGIGFFYDDGRFVSSDIVRFQRVVNTLYRNGVLSTLSSSEKEQRKCVLEIGAGYGGLAHHLSRILGNITVVIVDLPEMLLFSGPYLTLLNPDKKIYVYDSSDFLEFIRSSEAHSYDFILVPNYQVQSLRDWRFDLALNIDSFQEMREDQVNEYLDFMSTTCTGVLYSLNVDRHPGNSELSDYSELLSAKFELTEVLQPIPPENLKLKLRKTLRSAFTSVGLLDRPKTQRFPIPRELICTARSMSAPETIGR